MTYLNYLPIKLPELPTYLTYLTKLPDLPTHLTYLFDKILKCYDNSVKHCPSTILHPLFYFCIFFLSCCNSFPLTHALLCKHRPSTIFHPFIIFCISTHPCSPLRAPRLKSKWPMLKLWRQGGQRQRQWWLLGKRRFHKWWFLGIKKERHQLLRTLTSLYRILKTLKTLKEKS